MKKGRRTHPASHAPAGRPSTRRRGPNRSLLLSLMLAAGIVTLAAASTLFSGGVPRAEAARTAQGGAGGDQAISAEALQQIQALVEEKKSRTPAQRKIDSQLLYASKMDRGQSIAAGVQTLSVNVEQSEGGRVVVDITGSVGDSLLQTLEANGAKVLVSTPRYNSLRAEVSLDRLEAIAASPDVRYIQSKQEATTSRAGRAAGGPAGLDRAAAPAANGFPLRAARVRERLTQALAKLRQDDIAAGPGAETNVGPRNSEGDATHRANVARRRFNVDGTGIKIGVLSDGVVNLAFAQSTGDLPPDVTVLPGQAGTGDEGTAMLEIIHDLAPGAQLYFATAFSSLTSFADNIRKLRQAGCDVIVDDVFYFVESPFHDGQTAAVDSETNGAAVTQAVNDVTADGAMYFSSAGNSGNVNDGTAGVWEGDFMNGGTLTTIGGAGAGPVHDFNPAAAVTQFDTITLGSGSPIALFWSDPLGGSGNDYDLYILNSTGTTIVAASTGGQDGTQDPIEIVGGATNVTNNRIVVAKFSGADRFLHVNTNRGRLLFNTPGQTHGHSSAADAYSVAATPAFLPFGNPPNTVGPFPAPFNSSNKVELFSSDGPRKLYFRPDGTPYTPGNFSSTGGIVRQKPDITAADGVSVTGAGGFSNPFYGTSAAAPHAAAIAGLIKAARPALTPAQIRTALTSSAIDIEAPGVDRDSGAGIIMTDASLQAAGIATTELEIDGPVATEVSGNGNGFVEPGERGSLLVAIRNTGANPATNIIATLTTSTPGVTILPTAMSTYPTIPPGGTAFNNTPFQFIVGSSVPTGTVINFTLTINYSGGTVSQRVLNFTVNVSRFVTVNTALDTVAPPSGEGYTAATGLQTGRLVRTGNTSVCGITKANPGVNAADQTVPHRFDSYSFQNTSTVPICVTVTLTTSVQDANNLQSGAYAPTFNPAVPNENYIGDISFNFTGVATRSYSFTVPANTSFVVVVNEPVGGGSIGTIYTLRVEGLPRTTAAPTLTTLQFGQASYTVQENCTALNVNVTRGGDATLPLTVDYTTVNGTATNRSDYNKALGTLQFAAGQTSATIPLLINEDSLVEGNETFTVTLSNAQGIEVGLGATPTATVQITDDATEPSTNAIDDTATFVCQQYHDFLNREPDAAGRAFWINNIDSCGASASCRSEKRTDTSAAFFLSTEFQQTGFLVHRFYQAAFGRRVQNTVPLTYDEFQRDTQRVGRGVIIGQAGALDLLEANRQAYALEFVTRADFLAAYPRTQNEVQFVDALNANSGNALSTNERNALVAQLVAANNSDAARASVLRQVAEDSDLRASEFNRAFVLAQYFGYLQRNPNDSPDTNFSGFTFWFNKLNQFAGDFRRAEMVRAFVTSAEYRRRFGTN